MIHQRVVTSWPERSSEESTSYSARSWLMAVNIAWSWRSQSSAALRMSGSGLPWRASSACAAASLIAAFASS